MAMFYIADLVPGVLSPQLDAMSDQDQLEHMVNGDSDLSQPVSFIVGDESDVGSSSSPLENGHSEEEKRENTDTFAEENHTKNASYKDLFGLAERRKRLK